MNKFVRFSFWLIFIVGVMVLALAFYEPNDVTVTRSIVINTSKDVVFEQIAHLPNWRNWSTLPGSDTSAKITYNGIAGQPGSSLDWKGDEGTIGEGSIRNTGIDGTTMNYSFTLTKPGDFVADGVISVKDTGDASKVTLTFHKHFPFLANAALVIFNLDKYMGGDLERSLAALKKFTETEMGSYVFIKEVTYPGGIIAGIRDTLAQNEMITFFGDTYSLFVNTPSEKFNGPHIGIFYGLDSGSTKQDVFAGLHVTDINIPVNGISFSEIPPTKSYMAVHKGGYGSIQKVHAAIRDRINSGGMHQWLAVEEYIVYPGVEADSTKWVTNVYYLLQ